MTGIIAFASYTGAALIVITALSALHAVWRRRETHRLNILFLVASLAILRVMPSRPGLLESIRVALFAAQPYLLLRLVRHFRDVPPALQHGALALVAGGLFATLNAPASGVSLWSSVVSSLCAALAIYAAFAFTREATRTSGVTARRLFFAASGTWLFAGIYTLSALGPWSAAGRVAGQANQLFAATALACYFLAFSTPRRLRAAWQRTEQAKYLSRTAARDTEDRGASAADDLNQAAASSVGNAVSLVALRGARPGEDLVVKATTAPALRGVRLVPGASLVDRASEGRQPVTGSTAECDPDLGVRLAAFGTQVLVAPIASEAHTWGVVLVVQRRGSLFPEDDLQLLGQLGRYAAMSLDHAHLVTERRERERRAADRRIREVESRAGLMLDSITDYAMFVIDDRGRVVSWQPGAEHVFGYKAVEIQDQPAVQLFDLGDEAWRRLLADARQHGRAERDGPCRKRDGRKFVGATIIRRLQSDDDELAGFVAVTHDVTERRDLEERLRQSQKMEAIGQLAGGIAHDFNNLLTAILGYADWLAQDFGGRDPRRLQVAEIQKAAERAAGLTRQLLAFSRRQMLQPTAIHLSRLIADLVPMLRRVIGEHIEIVSALDPEVTPILGDRGQIEQIVLNLAVNARDAMPKGGRLTIKTSNVWLGEKAVSPDGVAGQFVLLDVSDSGIGMDDATKARIFEPFFTTKELGRGTGLGLATVYGIVKQMEGMVTVSSEPDQGATFRLYFPEARMRAEAVAAGRVGASDLPRGKETLLLVEDDEAVRVFLAQVLERHGYRVIAAEHQTAAMDLVREHNEPIHLVITDVVMPGGTGPELARAFELVCPGVPVLYISGYADAVLAQQGTLPKAGYFLQKPFSAADLLTRIAQILMPTT